MSGNFTVACVQFTAGPDPEPNLRTVSDLIRRARDAGADFIMTPEASNFIESGRRRREKARREANDPFLAGMRSVARETGAWLLIGSLVIDPTGEPDATAGETRLANRSFLVDPGGAILARYDKIHMFDIDLPNGESYRESNAYRPGGGAVVVETPWGRIGMSVCYDLRFPHLYRALALSGADFLWFPRFSPCRPAVPIGTCCCARGRSRPAVLFLPRRNGASTRRGGGAMVIHSSSIPGARCSRMPVKASESPAPVSTWADRRSAPDGSVASTRPAIHKAGAFRPPSRGRVA